MVFKLSNGLEYRYKDLSEDGFYELDTIKQTFIKTHNIDEELVEKIEVLITDYEAKAYQRLRKYPPLADQLDMMFDTIKAGKPIDKNCNWFKAIQAVKDSVPKTEVKKTLLQKIKEKIIGNA